MLAARASMLSRASDTISVGPLPGFWSNQPASYLGNPKFAVWLMIICSFWKLFGHPMQEGRNGNYGVLLNGGRVDIDVAAGNAHRAIPECSDSIGHQDAVPARHAGGFGIVIGCNRIGRNDPSGGWPPRRIGET